ncbi:MAG: type II toxin-antitoxin system YafQ family toxin [Acetomicrobium sp.]
MPVYYLDHSLLGLWNKYREIHIENDWILYTEKQKSDIPQLPGMQFYSIIINEVKINVHIDCLCGNSHA